jgi:hypothetical protein
MKSDKKAKAPSIPKYPESPAARRKWNVDIERERVSAEAALKRGQRTDRAFPNPK